MVPTPVLDTRSHAERGLCDAFRDLLADNIVVFHGIRWLRATDRFAEGQSDFLIVEPSDNAS